MDHIQWWPKYSWSWLDRRALPLKGMFLSSRENHAMPEPRFDIHFRGIKISAQGLAGIAAAPLAVAILLAVYRY
jgi:hypothetical protein